MAQASYRKRAADVRAIQLPVAAGGVSYALGLTITTNGTPVVTTAGAADWLVQAEDGTLSVMTAAAFALAYEASPGIGSDSSG